MNPFGEPAATEPAIDTGAVRTEAQQAPAGFPVIPAFWAGQAAVLALRSPDGRNNGTTPVAVPAGSLVVIIPSPAGLQMAQQLGIFNQPAGGGIVKG